MGRLQLAQASCAVSAPVGSTESNCSDAAADESVGGLVMGVSGEDLECGTRANGRAGRGDRCPEGSEPGNDNQIRAVPEPAAGTRLGPGGRARVSLERSERPVD